ncbi:carboxy terminal-processing peptidase [Candidatus Electronema sp. PJ]|uniref:carboxy terminal-processing peptidase n=1 Tax=Candidatus Electronema sp. PJ TaxID=3401572 RepID=UPI003AA870CA
MRLHRFFLNGLIASLLLGTSVHGKVMPAEFDAGRNRLIAYMLSHQLPAQHFSHKPLDAQTSKAAYDLYLKQLDPRKQFLLADDVSQLNVFADKIGEEISQGRITLPDAGMMLLNRRAGEVYSLVEQLLKAGFAPDRVDYLQTDAEKMTYPANAEELRDRWRRSLKLEVIDTYLEEIEKENKKREEAKKPLVKVEEASVDQKLWAAAIEKVRKKTRSYLDRVQKTDRQEHYNRYFDAIAKSFDPHTSYMAPESKEDFDIHMSGSLEGIGALLREDDGHIKVVNIIPGSPAEQQGQLQAEDVIMAVSEKDGEPIDISAMSIREAVSHIRGPKGTEVRLTVSRADGTRLIIPIIRDVVRLEETYVKSAVLKDRQGRKVGFLRIPGFYRDFENKDGRNVTDDTRSELHKLKKEGIVRLILDLRGNGGGSLSDAVEVSGLFLPGGPVVQVKNSEGKIILLEDEDKNVAYDGPMLVLVNQFAASASEILAAALQDYGRALVVGGAHTHGKGTVQALVDMNRNLPLLHLKKYENLGALKVTIQKFYRINGSSTQYKGVAPDVVVPSMLDYLETGEKYLDNSLPWDQVEPVRYTFWNGPRLDSAQAKQKSETYLAVSEKFKKIQTESLRAKERKDKSLVPVYLAGVLKDRQELERAKKEAEAAGVMDEEEDEEHPADKKEKKTLEQELAQDPYTDLALMLMDDSAAVAENSGSKK